MIHVIKLTVCLPQKNNAEVANFTLNGKLSTLHTFNSHTVNRGTQPAKTQELNPQYAWSHKQQHKRRTQHRYNGTREH